MLVYGIKKLCMTSELVFSIMAVDLSLIAQQFEIPDRNAVRNYVTAKTNVQLLLLPLNPYRSSTTNHLYTVKCNGLDEYRLTNNQFCSQEVETNAIQRESLSMTYRHVISLLNRPIFKNKRNYNPRFGLKFIEGSTWCNVGKISYNVLIVKVWVVHLREREREKRKRKITYMR